MIITLPLPDKRLGPNHTVGTFKGRLGKSAATKKARQKARLLTLAAAPIPCPTFTGYRLAFFHSTRRKRDDDNLAASCKAYRDGIADALGIDDHTLRMVASPTTAIDRNYPRVEITLLQ